jgi:NADPH:quinone reductase-like Zn-dependent oxidoreductase
VTRFLPLLSDFERGTLKPVVDSVYPIAKVAEAQARMEANANTGKIILGW